MLSTMVAIIVKVCYLRWEKFVSWKFYAFKHLARVCLRQLVTHYNYSFSDSTFNDFILVLKVRPFPLFSYFTFTPTGTPKKKISTSPLAIEVVFTIIFSTIDSKKSSSYCVVVDKIRLTSSTYAVRLVAVCSFCALSALMF